MLKNKKKSPKKVLVFGTFDGVHRGHLNFFKQARALAPKSLLIVSIARDVNVLKIKGQLPRFDEKSRLRLVEKCGLADKVLLSNISDYLAHIKKLRPEIIALGYDQVAYTEGLKEKLQKIDIQAEVVRLKPYKEHIYKSKFLNKRNLFDK